MAFIIEERSGRAGERTGTVYILRDATDTVRAEVWPFAGFNCLRWQTRTASGSWGDLLYTAPDWETNPVPTRSGHPVLFPFPNRIREGRFTFQGTEFSLPLNDPTKSNAIHGFTPRTPWQVSAISQGMTDAAVTGQFRLSRDLPTSLGLWPADCSLKLTYRLLASALRVEAVVQNFGPGPMPFGLGYHPYFRLPTVPDAKADDMVLETAAQSLWETDGGLPSGRLLPLPPDLDFCTPRSIGSTAIDNLLGNLRETDDPFPCVATLSHRDQPGRLRIHADRSFTQLVLFTPPHRTAVAIEPYTCATDAPNLDARGIASGWRILPVGETFTAAVEYRWDG